MAFMLSAGLLFALRNPAAIIQNVAGKADGMSQIGWQEALATAYLTKNAIGMMAKGVSAQNLGQLSGQTKNMVEGRGGWQDTFKAAEFQTTQQADDLHMGAGKARLIPRESKETLDQRAHAQAMDHISRAADEADKGSLMRGEYRKSRSVSYRDSQGNLRNMTLDSAPVALAEAAGKNAPDVARNRDIARKMLNQRIAVMVEHSDGSRYIQVDMSKVNKAREASIHEFVKKLEENDSLTNIKDKNAGTTLKNVIKDKL